MNKLKSRKFWVAVASGLFVILSEGLGLDIPSEAYWTVATIAIGYIVGEGIVDIRRK